jgi:hypothetical protein
MDNGDVLLNELLIDNAGKNGGYSRRQLAAVGIEWPPTKGWKKELVGKIVSSEEFRVFFRSDEKKAAATPAAGTQEIDAELEKQAWKFAFAVWKSKQCPKGDDPVAVTKRVRLAIEYASMAMAALEEESVCMEREMKEAASNELRRRNWE